MQLTPQNDVFAQDDEARRAQAEQTLWQTLGTLFLWRRFIISVTAVVAVAAVVITLLMPNWYRASARLLIPEGGGGLASSMLRGLPSAASILLGGGSGDQMRYLAILTSRSMMEAAVDTFDLVTVYELQDAKHPREAAIDLLRKNSDFEVDQKYEFLGVSVIDEDPNRAAEIANFFVRRLNEMNARLSSASARKNRTFIERRYLEALAAMDSVLARMQSFQQEYGVFDLPTQTQGFLEQVATLRASALEAEIQHEALLSQYGPDNPQVEAYREIAHIANQKYRNALQGSELLLPVPQTQMPLVARQYAMLEMERVIQESILEVIGPLYEQARLQEEREAEAVQVLDNAVPPAKKAGPRRSVIVILATFSAFVLCVVFALVYEWWDRNHVAFANQWRIAVRETEEERSRTSNL